jgi:hypothetical protein
LKKSIWAIPYKIEEGNTISQYVEKQIKFNGSFVFSVGFFFLLYYVGWGAN